MGTWRRVTSSCVYQLIPPRQVSSAGAEVVEVYDRRSLIKGSSMVKSTSLLGLRCSFNIKLRSGLKSGAHIISSPVFITIPPRCVIRVNVWDGKEWIELPHHLQQTKLVVIGKKTPFYLESDTGKDIYIQMGLTHELTAQDALEVDKENSVANKDSKYYVK